VIVEAEYGEKGSPRIFVVRKDGEIVEIPYAPPVNVDELIEALEEIRDLPDRGTGWRATEPLPT
jgi:hypothetical protein